EARNVCGGRHSMLPPLSWPPLTSPLDDASTNTHEACFASEAHSQAEGERGRCPLRARDAGHGAFPPPCLASALPRTAWQLLGRFAWPLHFLGLLGSSLAPLQVINVREAAAALRSDTPPPGWDGGAAVSVRLLVSIWPLFSSCSSPHALPLVSRLLLLPHSSVGASSGARACRRAWCSPGCVRARLELDLAALACAAARSCIPLSAGAGRVGVQGTWPCTWLCLIALLSFQKPGVNLTCR
ncbi:unnamed protein product, partial [Prorocentrum cordatum]